MRSWLASLLLCCIAGPGLAGEADKLPDYFGPSFDAVTAQPLATLPTTRPEASSVPTIVGRPDETGAIARGDVPVPPRRPGAPADPEPVAEVPSTVGSAPPPGSLGAAFAVEVPANVQIKNPLSFVIGNRRFDLVSTDGLDVKTACTREANGRCIVHPMRNLKEAIAGRTLQCRPAGDGPNARVVCQRQE